MKNKTIGTYKLGGENVRIELHDGLGGTGEDAPDDGGVGCLSIGGNHKTWAEFLEIVTHELFEYSLDCRGCRMVRTSDYSRDSSACLFMFDHALLSVVAADVGHYLAAALPAIQKAWNKWNKAKRKAKK